MTAHQTVLRNEAVEALVANPAGRFVDCTYGRGGHTAAILDRLQPGGRLMVIDQDVDAVADARRKHGADDRVVIVHGSFAEVARFIDEHEMNPVDGVLLDLGVSSPQFDDGRRGFSFMHDGPLDMRMDRTRGETAQAWLERAGEQEIARVISRYGEERFARRIARAIVRAREESEIDTTSKLAQIVDAAVPKREQTKRHPATKTFQAIRIHINGELDALEACLESIVSVLASGGRLVVISFHSLEDRIVKRFMRNMARGERLPDRLPVRDADIKRTFRLIGKPVKPGEDEVDDNRRARSSIMRVAEKL